MDQFGDTIWTRTIGTINDEWGYDVLPTLEGGMVVVGYTKTNSYDALIIKTDSNGIPNWIKVYCGNMDDYAASIQETIDGGFLICGTTSSYGAGLSDIYLLKVDTSGVLLWSKTFGGLQNEYGTSMKRTLDGGFILVGYTSSFGLGSEDIYLIKLDLNGDSIWTKTYGGPMSDYGWDVIEMSTGEFVIVGSTQSFGTGSINTFMIG